MRASHWSSRAGSGLRPSDCNWRCNLARSADMTWSRLAARVSRSVMRSCLSEVSSRGAQAQYEKAPPGDPGGAYCRKESRVMLRRVSSAPRPAARGAGSCQRSEEHTSELQSRENLVCRLLLENKH